MKASAVILFVGLAVLLLVTATVTVAGQENETATPDPACNQMCTDDYVPVCGPDGVTYSNWCNWESSNCLQGGADQVDTDTASYGECPTV